MRAMLNTTASQLRAYFPNPQAVNAQQLVSKHKTPGKAGGYRRLLRDSGD
jgi:hypothetical protein